MLSIQSATGTSPIPSDLCSPLPLSSKPPTPKIDSSQCITICYNGNILYVRGLVGFNFGGMDWDADFPMT